MYYVLDIMLNTCYTSVLSVYINIYTYHTNYKLEITGNNIYIYHLSYSIVYRI